MAKLISLAVAITAMLVFSSVFVTAKGGTSDFENAGTKVDPNLQTFYIDKHLQAVVGQPTEFIRLGHVSNLGTENSTFKTTLHKKANVISVILGTAFEEMPTIDGGWDGTITDGVEYKKNEKGIVKITRKKVDITVPVNEMRYFEIHYLMPAPEMTYTTTQNDASNYGGQYTESTSYDIHTFNVLSTANLPSVPSDWDYDVFVNDASGARQNLRHFEVDDNNDGKIDRIGWLTPRLSNVDGDVGGKPAGKPPTKVKNHDFKLVRADNAYLPVGWVTRQSVDLDVKDELPWANSPYATVWPYSPFSDEGYDGDNSSLKIREDVFYPIFATPVNFTTSLSLNFKYKPKFSGCVWRNGIEIMFPEGPFFSDTTHWFSLLENGSVESDEFTVSSAPDKNGWYNINITKTFDYLDGPRVARLFFRPLNTDGSCSSSGTVGEFWVDNVLFNADT